ncbi:hypothetical protein ACFXG4_43855 [Nocardia sp. NPDC059246]|uniref:hypothetical protein n=1 Tax=unclassified Nocardia TaxID=2637762 RepID=UPI003679FAB8
MTGTDKQVGWATTVRQAKLDEFEAGLTTEPQRSQMRAVLLRETCAAVWIDYRDTPWGAVWLANLTSDEREALLSSTKDRV